MSGPVKTFMVSAMAIVLVTYSMLSADEAPGTALKVLQYVLLAGGIVGVIGSLMKMGK
jgi:hypothetical protein